MESTAWARQAPVEDGQEYLFAVFAEMLMGKKYVHGMDTSDEGTENVPFKKKHYLSCPYSCKELVVTLVNLQPESYFMTPSAQFRLFKVTYRLALRLKNALKLTHD